LPSECRHRLLRLSQATEYRSWVYYAISSLG